MFECYCHCPNRLYDGHFIPRFHCSSVGMEGRDPYFAGSSLVGGIPDQLARMHHPIEGVTRVPREARGASPCTHGHGVLSDDGHHELSTAFRTSSSFVSTAPPTLPALAQNRERCLDPESDKTVTILWPGPSFIAVLTAAKPRVKRLASRISRIATPSHTVHSAAASNE